MKYIKLTQGKVVMVDDDIFELIGGWKWCYTHGYAVKRYQGKKIYMHRFIMNAKNYQSIDHINSNKLDNRKCNLRFCNQRNNTKNKLKTKNLTSSIFKGVCWDKVKKMWLTSLRKDYKHIFIGYFKEERHAAMAYDIWAKELFGEYAKTNFSKVLQLNEALANERNDYE